MSVLFKRTKILATVGPAVDSYEKIEGMVQRGVNGFRFNFSHATFEASDRQMAWIREASEKNGKPVAILQDLQGPKIRLGDLVDNRLPVVQGDELVLDYGVEHDGGHTLPIQYNLAEKVKSGETIYIFDGKVRTTVLEVTSPTAIKVRVENDGTLMSRKGINLPDTDFGGDILTPKDLRDIDYGADKDYDYISLSFVQSPNDINNLRQLLKEKGSQARVIAKIETKAAIQDDILEEIVKVSDGIMVARGDLAVEAGAEVVPIVQRKIIALCRRYGKLSIVATQMMASMVDNPEPTRAEVSDIANAVVQGVDTVMLSDETANGSYPLETVAQMRKVVLYTQQHTRIAPLGDDLQYTENPRRDAISDAAVHLAEKLHVAAIVAETKSGATAINIAGHRPNLPVLAVTSSKRSAQQLALVYASQSFVRPDGERAGLELARELKSRNFFDASGEVTVAIVSGRQPGLIGGTDTIRVRVLE